MRYPDFEVIVVDDGSKDDTVAKLVAEFDLVEVPLVVDRLVPMKGEVLATYLSRKGSHNLVLVTKSNGGKADALNVGINLARKELVCMVDADSLLDPDALLHVSRPFADDPDQVVAAGGVIRVANGSTVTKGRVTDVRMPRTWLARVQVVEYLRAFMIGRAGWSATGGLLIISGAFGIFRKDVLATVGGMATDCIGEDAELVVRIYRWLGEERIDGKVVFVSEPVAWTEAPEDRAVLRKQRRRWHRGLAEILTRHRDMLFRPKYGVIGMLTMPWFVVVRAARAVPGGLRAGLLPGRAPAAGRREHRLAALGPGRRLVRAAAAHRLDLLLVPAHPGRAAGRGDVLPALPRRGRPAARGVGRGGGELRLPPAQRLVADGRRHRGDAEGPARLGRHAAQGLRHQAVMGRTVGQRVARVIATAAVLVLLVGSVGVIGLLVTTRSVDNLVDHIEPARQANDGVLQDLTDADAGIRGWAISGDQAALVPFFAAMDELPGHQSDLERYERPDRRASTGFWRTRTRRSTPGSRRT